MPENHFHAITTKVSAPVWNMVPFGDPPRVVLEQRDEQKRQVSFSLYEVESNRFIWKDVVLPEKWWINLAGIAEDGIALNVFESTDNPDKTNVVLLHPESGEPISNPNHSLTWRHTKEALYPFQYLDGEPDFETVKNFLHEKLAIIPRLGVEYLEYGDYIIISCYDGKPADFINRLLVFNRQGECCYEVEIGTNLKGMGINTFFITSGTLFFVKNRTELVTFRIV